MFVAQAGLHDVGSRIGVAAQKLVGATTVPLVFTMRGKVLCAQRFRLVNANRMADSFFIEVKCETIKRTSGYEV